MRAWVLLAVATAVTTLPLGSAQAQQIRSFAPDSAWAVDYGDDYCRLLRDFKNGNDTINLVVERINPGPTVRLIAIGDSLKTFRGARDITYKMLPSGAERTAPRLVGTASSGQTMINLGSTTLMEMAPRAAGEQPARYDSAAEAKQAGAVSGILLDKGMSPPVQLDTGSLEGPVAALQACADDLLTSWGLDAAKHKTASRSAVPATAAAGWLPEGTVAFSEFSKLAGGNNELRVMVDAAGKPTECRVQWPSLSQTLNDTVCKAVMANGSFTPALDSGGQPMASYWATSLYGLMPRRTR